MNSRTSTVSGLIDAAVENPELTTRLVRENPGLINERYLHGETPLHFLVVENYSDGVKLLISLGFDVNSPNEFGDPPLLDTVRLRNHRVSEILLNAGANANFRSDTYGSLIEVAQEQNDHKMVELLKRHGAVEQTNGPDGELV